MGLDDSVLCADHNAGSDRLSNSALLGDRLIVVDRLWEHRITRLAGRTDLPRRHADVRKASFDTRSDPLGEASVETRSRQ